MKKLVVLVVFLFVSLVTFAQETTQVINGESITLQEEVSGEISLYYTKNNGEYRYFVAKNGSFYELKNTKDASGDYQYEYRTTLASLTSDASVSATKTSLMLGSLTDFVVAYNQQKDTSYTYENKHFKLGVNLGVLGGVGNNVYTTNVNNTMVPQVLVEAEFFDALKPMSRHSAFAHLKQTFSAEDYDYSSTQFSLNYRFKLVRNENLKLYAQTKLVTITSASATYTTTDTEGDIVSYTEKGTNFDAPVMFGIGADFKIANNTYISFQYNDFVALNNDSNGEFPVDLNLGVKFTL
ncbi:hypothetical protein SAMN05216480_11318 [Pustulibacterium marinum]|uniref:Outer membrane protein beta-barrel domain-containing protein n=1 Tax=Pustulibacterium marinum TaxID=1224947 RepID=A0A1I7I5T8_9FLAO|nr:hypothetical protein [Pustulibacterium marinum]SFU68297.1 hypothetical protein SAMN05216480_11318 [Pustulibacterium marinum]